MPTEPLMDAIRDWLLLRERLFDSNWSYDRHLNAAEERVIGEYKAALARATAAEGD